MSERLSRVCLVDAPPALAEAFEEAGHPVLRVQASPAPRFDLPAALSEAGFVPDLVLQVERLGPRSVLEGLESLGCPLLLWCVDPHLNAHWHACYARLFDLVCSTQRAWIPALKERGARDVRWLPWFGLDLPQLPWGEREHGLAFVGRVTRSRSARKWMVELLERRGEGHNPAIHAQMPYRDMLALYGRSKLVPNESIGGEVNFRLFEGASGGCLVLSQDIEEQTDLFEPGREIDTYADVLELDHKLKLYLENDRLTRTMGTAARARVMAEHLPIHRAERILEYARDAARNRARGREAAKWTALSLANLWEAGLPTVALDELLECLGRAGNDADVAAEALRVQAATGMEAVLDDNLARLLARPVWEDSPDLALAASTACLRRDNFAGAAAFLRRFLRSRGVERPTPASPSELLTRWAKELQRMGRVVRPGFPFDATRHLPASAADCLMLVQERDPGDLSVLRLLETMLRSVNGSVQSRMGFLSVLTLHRRKDWRLALELGLANLTAYRLEAGLNELDLARMNAVEQGQEDAFLRVLKGRDPSGLLVRRLS